MWLKVVAFAVALRSLKRADRLLFIEPFMPSGAFLPIIFGFFFFWWVVL
jgi:hypothetical protein